MYEFESNQSLFKLIYPWNEMKRGKIITKHICWSTYLFIRCYKEDWKRIHRAYRWVSQYVKTILLLISNLKQEKQIQMQYRIQNCNHFLFFKSFNIQCSYFWWNLCIMWCWGWTSKDESYTRAHKRIIISSMSKRRVKL